MILVGVACIYKRSGYLYDRSVFLAQTSTSHSAPDRLADMVSTSTSPLDGWTVSPGQYVPGYVADKPYVYVGFELAAQAYDALQRSTGIKPTAILKNTSGLFELRIGRVMLPSSCGETTYARSGELLARPAQCPDESVEGFHKIEGMYLAGHVTDEHGEPVAPCTFDDIKSAAAEASLKVWIGGFVWDGHSKYELRRGGLLLPSPAGEVAFVKSTAVMEGFLNWCEQKGYKPRGLKRSYRLIASTDEMAATHAEVEGVPVPAASLDRQAMLVTYDVEDTSTPVTGA
jgi:hypothetical protein